MMILMSEESRQLKCCGCSLFWLCNKDYTFGVKSALEDYQVDTVEDLQSVIKLAYLVVGVRCKMLRDKSSGVLVVAAARGGLITLIRVLA